MAAAALEKQIKTLIASAGKLHDRLEVNPNILADPPTQLSIQDLITLAEKCAKGRASIFPKEDHEGLDRKGTDLWNLSTKLRRAGVPDEKQLLKLRHLAYILLDSAQKSTGRNSCNCLRLLKVANKAAKWSLGMNSAQMHDSLRRNLDMTFFFWWGNLSSMMEDSYGSNKYFFNYSKDIGRAESLLSDSAKYESDLSKLVEKGDLTDDLQTQRACCEFWILRIALSWEQKNLSVASFMFIKAAAPTLQTAFHTPLVEQICEILFKIGRDLLEQGDPETSATWLKRAFDIMESHSPSESYLDSLRFSVMQGLVNAYISVGKLPGNDFSRARNVVEMVIQKWPSRLASHCLNIELANAQGENSRLIQEAIKSMITEISITDESFRIVIDKIVELRDKDCNAACETMDFFIETKLLAQNIDWWIEQAFVTRMWMVVGMRHHSTGDEGLSNLQQLVAEMSKCLAKPLSAKATYSSHVLLWKKSEVLINQGKHRAASNWCKVALHTLFDQKGALNRCKFARRIISCAIEAQEYGAVHEIYQGMEIACQNTAATQFLMFKQALRSSNVDLAKSSLDTLQSNKETSYSVLYACALEAQDSSHKNVTIQTFRMVLDKMDRLPHTEATQFPILLRCTIRLVMAQVESTKLAIAADIKMLCELFETGSDQATSSKATSGSSIFSSTELDWFSRNAYNLAIKACDEWEPSFALRFAESCLKFINSYPVDMEEQSLIELNLRNAFCSYLCASVCTFLARKTENVEEQLRKYESVRRYVASFRERRLELKGNLSDKVEPDLNKKLATLITYDYEACVHLQKWDEMEKITQEACLLKSSETFGLLADITLCSKASPQTILRLLQKIVDQSLSLQSIPKSKLARWIRCLIQLSVVSDATAMEHLVQQVSALCTENQSEPYPQDELEWLAATLWNFAVDMNCVGNLPGSKRWAEYTLSIAGLVNDSGNLLKDYQRRFMALKF